MADLTAGNREEKGFDPLNLSRYLVRVNRNLNLNLSTLRNAATEDGLLNALRLCRVAVGF